MDISSVNSAASALPVQNTQSSSKNARAADGDYKTQGPGRAAVKDADGDYKPSSPAAKASSAVQQALTSLKVAG